ncbi:MAG: phosphate acyltransferase PlsX [Fibrobacter sp.]|nr:phosphate acyltransferase PlsX [Fibrobacter sp.]
MISIAIDAMGGDHAPKQIVEGAVLAQKENPGLFKLFLCGPQDIIAAELKRLNYTASDIEVFHAPDIVGMDESPAAVLKTKPNSSLVACVALQKKGVVQASVSAGNSGAMMAACLMLLGRVGNISRPAIACNIPAKKPLVMLDMGANVDEKPQVLVDFATCGSIYAEKSFQLENPRVGLLNMGEEENKGPDVIQETYQLLKNSPLNFVGNIEARDIFSGNADVIVTSGYTGNVVLKLIEGFYELHFETFGVIDSESGRDFQEKWDYRNHGGALLLGLKGTGVIAHGCSDAKAISTAISYAHGFAKNKIAESIAERYTGEQA